MNEDKPIPLMNVTCKKCGHTFLTQLGTLWENNGKLECSECHKSDYYAPNDLSNLSNSGSR
jgi:formylmethanofuran dehydrogenase subunit E